MSSSKRRSTAAATAVVVLLSMAQFVLFTIEAAPAAAHHPEVTAVSICEEDAVFIEFEVTAWATDDLDRRHNNDVRLTIGDEQVASGAFNAGNDFSFSGTIDASAHVGQTVTLRATAVARWGEAEDKGSANQYREALVTVLGDCVGSTTTLPPYEPPVCPTPDENAVAFELDHDGRVRAAGSLEDATSGPYAISLPAGVYDVYLTSRDRNHSESFDPEQTAESYYVRGFFDGATVWESPSLSDLGDDQVNLTELVVSGERVPELDAVSAVHAAYPNVESNSIVPVCVVFVPKPQPEPQPVDVVVSGTCVLVEKQAFARISVDSIHPDGDVVVTIGGVSVPEGGGADLALDIDLAVVASSASGSFEPSINVGILNVSSRTCETPSTTRVTSPPPAKAALGDLVWFDENQNGRQDGGDLEFPIQGATVSLLTPDGTVLEDRVTGPDGRYLFDELDAGNYRVRVCLQGADYTTENAFGVADDVDSDVFVLGEGCGMTALINLPAGVTDLTWDAGVIVEVKGIQVEPTTTTAPPPIEPVTVETLPFTGAETEQTVMVALGAMLAGAALLLAVSRREEASSVVDSGTSWSNQRT